jgi:hypothetical protein
MKPDTLILAVTMVLAAPGAWPSAQAAGAAKAELDSAKNARLFESHFGRYGHLAEQTVTRGPGTVRFMFPAQRKGLGPAGLYSYFALAGDFEVSVTYELPSLARPKSGRGVCVGLTVDTEGSGGSVSFVRGHWPDRGSGYALIRRQKASDGLTQEMSFLPSEARRGRLVLRREKGEVVTLMKEATGDAQELGRVPFTDGTVRKTLLYADPGNAPVALDARLTDLVVRGEEITGGIPARDARAWRGWWAISAGGLIVGALSLYAVCRRWRAGRLRGLLE